MDVHKEQLEMLRKMPRTLRFDYGTFWKLGPDQKPDKKHRFKTADVNAWDFDTHPETKFKPTGDNGRVELVFRWEHFVVRDSLLALDRILVLLGSDAVENFVLIYYFVTLRGASLFTTTPFSLSEKPLYCFCGFDSELLEARAARRIYEEIYPEEYERAVASKEGFVIDAFMFLRNGKFERYWFNMMGSPYFHLLVTFYTEREFCRDY